MKKLRFIETKPILVMYILALSLSIAVIFSSPDSSSDRRGENFATNSSNDYSYNTNKEASNQQQNETLYPHHKAERQYYLPVSKTEITSSQLSQPSSLSLSSSAKQPILITPYVVNKADTTTTGEETEVNTTTNQDVNEASASSTAERTNAIVVVTKEEYSDTATALGGVTEKTKLVSSSTENEPPIYILKTMATKTTTKGKNGSNSSIPPNRIEQKLAIKVQQKSNPMIQKTALDSEAAISNHRRLRAQTIRMSSSSPLPPSSVSSSFANDDPTSDFSVKSLLGVSALLLVVVGRSRSARRVVKQQYWDELIYHDESDNDDEDIFGLLENELSFGVGYACDSSTESGGYGSFESSTSSSSSSSWSGDLLDKFDL